MANHRAVVAAGLFAAVALGRGELAAAPDRSEEPRAGPGKRSGGRRGGNGHRTLPAPTTDVQSEMLRAAEAKRERRLERNRRVARGAPA